MRVLAVGSPPDPGEAGTLAELVERLRALKVWAGDPSYDVITTRINAAWQADGKPAGELARRTTVADCFRQGRRRVNTELVAAIVRALHPDPGAMAHWRQALRVITGEVEAAAQVRVQDELPGQLAEFTGRTAELDRLAKLLTRPEPVAIVGMAGVGKSQLATRTGHLLRGTVERVLFVNLRGFHADESQPPAEPGAVLDGFLRLLGVPGHKVPHGLVERAELYRQRLQDHSTLVILDNAADELQIEYLLPAVPSSRTLVTSRRDLNFRSSLTVNSFSTAEAAEYLALAVPGVEVGSDPDAAERIARRCGHLPLALGLVAGHMRSMAGWTLTDHADRLDERHGDRRLDTEVTLALDLSYRRLPDGLQRLLRLLALHPGPDFDLYDAAALGDLDPDGASSALEELRRNHLLEAAGSGRYRFHDLVLAYAHLRAADLDPPRLRRAALGRLSTASGTAVKKSSAGRAMLLDINSIRSKGTPMRKLKLQVQTTVDGFMAGPNHEMDWMRFPWTVDLSAYVDALTTPVDTIVLGRKLAEGFIPAWASRPEHEDEASIDWMNNTPKVVVSQSLTESPWDNAVVANDLVKAVTELKSQPGGDLIAYGGSTLVTGLIAEGLVDDIYLFVNPTAIGAGLPVFPVGAQPLDLVEAVGFECGITALHFVPRKA